MRAVGDIQDLLPGQSAVRALIFVDIYTLLSHSPLHSRHGESPALPAPREHGTPAAASGMQRAKSGCWGDAPETKQPPMQLGQRPSVRGLCQLCCSVPMAAALGTRLLPFVKHICHTKKSVGSVPESRAAPLRRGGRGKDGSSFVPHLGTKDCNEDGLLKIARRIRP